MRSNESMDEILSEFSRKSAEERAFILIRNYCDTAERSGNEGKWIPDDLAESFHSWFCDPRNDREKRAALDRLIEECDRKLKEFEISDTNADRLD